jgi:hypothetical protein
VPPKMSNQTFPSFSLYNILFCSYYRVFVFRKKWHFPVIMGNICCSKRSFGACTACPKNFVTPKNEKEVENNHACVAPRTNKGDLARRCHGGTDGLGGGHMTQRDHSDLYLGWEGRTPCPPVFLFLAAQRTASAPTRQRA